jgi:hypothetical protein
VCIGALFYIWTVQAQTSRGATTGANHAVDAAFLERAESFQAARTVFLRDQTLPAGFNFPMYLHRALYGFVLDLVEASPGNWAVVRTGEWSRAFSCFEPELFDSEL